MRTFKVRKDEAGKRADIVVAKHLPAHTRSSLKQLFSKNLVFIEGLPIKASHKLESRKLIQIDMSLLKTEPSKIDIPVVYEDEDVIVMDKPIGVLAHAKGALNDEATVASFIKPRLNDKNLVGNRAGIVHRLDRATSGLIIAAKNEKALKWLQKQFSTRKIQKIYIAVVEGIPSPKEAIIDAPIERNPKKPQTFRVGGNGRSATTNYKILKVLNPVKIPKGSDGAGKSYSLLELKPQTGRTHQLRVHLKYIGHPIVGDRVYGHGGENMFLHAKSLEITLPGGQTKKFTAAEPKIFKDFVQ